jgi:hypothetical protein
MSGRPKHDPHGKQFCEVKGFVSLYRNGSLLKTKQFSSRSRRKEAISELTADAKRLQKNNQTYYIHIIYND